MHTRGVEFEVRKLRKVYLIRFDKAIKIKVVKFVYTTKNSDLSPYFYSFHTSQFVSEEHEHFNNI